MCGYPGFLKHIWIAFQIVKNLIVFRYQINGSFGRVKLFNQIIQNCIQVAGCFVRYDNAICHIFLSAPAQLLWPDELFLT